MEADAGGGGQMGSGGAEYGRMRRQGKEGGWRVGLAGAEEGECWMRGGMWRIYDLSFVEDPWKYLLGA